MEESENIKSLDRKKTERNLYLIFRQGGHM